MLLRRYIYSNVVYDSLEQVDVWRIQYYLILPYTIYIYADFVRQNQLTDETQRELRNNIDIHQR